MTLSRKMRRRKRRKRLCNFYSDELLSLSAVGNDTSSSSRSLLYHWRLVRLTYKARFGGLREEIEGGRGGGGGSINSEGTVSRSVWHLPVYDRGVALDPYTVSLILPLPLQVWPGTSASTTSTTSLHQSTESHRTAS